MDAIRLARGLGWASIGIGLAELAAPRQIEHCLGIEEGRHVGILRAMGVREIMQGVDILTHDDPVPGIWARIAGDAIDMAALRVAATKTRRPGSFAGVLAMVSLIGALDVLAATQLSHDGRGASGAGTGGAGGAWCGVAAGGAPRETTATALV